RIQRLGTARACPPDRRPLVTEHPVVLGLLDRQLQAIVDDGTYFRQRLEQLVDAPPAVTQSEAARDALRDQARQASEREGTLRAQAGERARPQKERAGLANRTQEI